jgi:signal transduction histidine kinase/ActR/RegA family two-component response regulator
VSARASIRWRVMRLVMTITLFALLLSGAVHLLYELQTRRSAWLEDLQTQSALMAQSSAPALSFDDPRAARETLALLRLRPQIEAAAIYAADGVLFASYAGPEQAASAPPRRAADGAVFEGQRVVLQQRIESAGETLGSFVLQARDDIVPRLLGYVAMLGVVTLATLGLAALVASNLQRAITEPIVALANVARDVEQQRNYALRAPKQTEDELGALVDAFNNMLGELGSQTQALQTASRRKDEFLATLAHELRNPLAPISTALVLLARDDLDPVERARLQQMMQRQLGHLVRLIDDLLEVSRLSTGRLQLRVEETDVVEAVREAWDSVLPTALAQRHEMQVQWPEQPCRVRGDRTRLTQVFVNLLSNAVRYTDPGGSVSLAFESEDDQVVIKVRDTGIGIDPSMQAEVFDMFVQVEPSMGRGRTGLGVGLSLARQLVELHGGTITLESAGLGQGSTFTVRVPCLPAASPEAAPAAAPAAAPDALSALHARERAHVLVADDNRDNAESLGQVLRSLGYSVSIAFDGASALRAARQRMPDVGLFDIGMPGMNGYQLATALRGLPGGGRALLVAITGWGQDSDRQRALAGGFDRHFVKPVDVRALAELLQGAKRG